MLRNKLTSCAIAALAAGLAIAPAGASEDQAVQFAIDRASTAPRHMACQVRNIDPVSGVEVTDENYRFQAVASTGASRLAWMWSLGKVVREELVLTDESVDLSRVQSGAVPFLRDHYQWSTNYALGAVEGMRLEGGQLVADVKMSRRPEVAGTVQDIQDGILRSVSIGYEILAYELDESVEGEVPVMRVTKFRIIELSLVSVPADPSASVRTQFPNVALPLLERAIRAAEAAGETPASPAASKQQKERKMEDEVIQTPAAAAAATDAAVRAERARVSAIRATAARHNLDAAIVDAAIDSGETVEAFNGRALDAIAARQATITVTNPGLSPEGTREAMADALVAQITSREATGAAVQFRGIRPQEVAFELLRAGGVSVDRRNPGIIADRSLHVTADFPQLMASVANKVMLFTYQSDPEVRRWQSFFRQRDLVDFKPTPLVHVGMFPLLEKLVEGGEIKFGTFSEGGVAVKLETYAKRVAVTRQMIVNDDLGAFADLALAAGVTIADQERQIAVSLIAGQAEIAAGGDETVLFKIGENGNFLKGLDLDVDGLSEARKTLRYRRNADGHAINARGAWLVVSPDLEVKAEQLVRLPMAPTNPGEGNPHTGSMEVFVDGDLDDGTWAVVANPTLRPALSWGRLSGAAGPIVSTSAVPGRDGIEFQVINDFYAAGVSDLGIFGAKVEE